MNLFSPGLQAGSRWAPETPFHRKSCPWRKVITMRNQETTPLSFVLPFAWQIWSYFLVSRLEIGWRLLMVSVSTLQLLIFTQYTSLNHQWWCSQSHPCLCHGQFFWGHAADCRVQFCIGRKSCTMRHITCNLYHAHITYDHINVQHIGRSPLPDRCPHCTM